MKPHNAKKERLLHHVTISVFCKPYDKKEDVLAGLDALSPLPTATLLEQDPKHDPERPHTVHYRLPDVELTVQQTETDEGKMTIYTLFFRKISSTNHFLHQILDAMTQEERKAFRDEPGSLLDFEGKLSLRLDKELLKKGRLSLTDDGTCYQVKAAIAAYPKTEEQVLRVLDQILQS
jgi:RNA binding exosome subunit